MAADSSKGVRVVIARGFAVGRTVVPVVIEEGLDGISLDWKSTDNGNLEVGPRGRTPRLRWVHHLGSLTQKAG